MKSEKEIKDKLKELSASLDIAMNWRPDYNTEGDIYATQLELKKWESNARLVAQIKSEILLIEWLIGEKIITRKWAPEICLMSWEHPK